METSKHETWNQPQEQQFRPEHKQVVAGITGILFGGLGSHKFILGYPPEGLIQLLLYCLTSGIVGSLLGLIEGSLY